MTKRIDTLTDAQRATFGAYADQWIARGWRTGPMDDAEWAKVQDAIRACYRYAGQSEPKVIVRVPSPLVGALAAPIAAFLIELRKRGAVGGAVDDAVRGAVRGAVDGAVRDAVDDAVRGAVGDAVRGAVDDAVRGANSLRRLIGAAIGRTMRETWWRYMGGQFWVGGWWWGSPAFVSFFREVCGLALPEKIEQATLAYQATAESACWWWPHRDFVMVCERPTRIERNEQGRLHATTQKAICWPDGWGFCSVNGVRVPDEIIENPQSITANRIEDEQNAEIRRVMLELFGLERFLRESGAKRVHQDRFGELYERSLGGRDYRFVRVLNSTPEPDGTHKSYVLSVPATVLTAHEAVAWTFNLRPEQYTPTWES